MTLRPCLLALSLWALPCLASAQGALPGLSSAVPDRQVLALEVGVHKLLRQQDAVARVAVGDPAVADVTVINNREVLVTAKKAGTTSLIIWPRGGGQSTELRLSVGPAKDPLRPARPDPALASATVDAQEGLRGQTQDLLTHQSARKAAKAAASGNAAPLDRSVVDVETQVMTQVRVVEVKRSAMVQYGLNIFKSRANTVAGLSGPGSGVTVGLNGYGNTDGRPIAAAFNLAIGNPIQGLLGVLSLLESRGLARTYAEPTLTAMSGHTASFLAGGEFPVPVSQGGANGGVTIQYREFGVRLRLTPTVLASKRIALKVAPEVSDLDFTSGITTAGVSVPALVVRRTDTTVELGDGESFVISGLVSNAVVKNVNKVPWLGDVPVLGAFFKSISSDQSDKELIMIVTPRLVRPLKAGAATPRLPGAAAAATKQSTAALIFLEDGRFGEDDYGYSK